MKLTYGIIWIAALLLVSSGCRLPFGKRGTSQQPVVFTGPASRDQIIGAVNANAGRVNQLESRLKLSVPGLPAITGDLAVEQPKRLRMQAGFMGTSAGGIDVGSNDDVFWLWVKSALGGQEPAVYFGRHNEYATSNTRQAIPIDPSFLMDSLGLFQYDADATHEGPYSRPDGSIEMRSRRSTATGETIHITVLDRTRGNVTQQHLYNENQLTASSYASKFYYDETHQVSLPQNVIMVAMPGTAQEMKLTIEADDYTINQLYSGPALWEMPHPDGIPVIDVARADPTGTAMRPITRSQSPWHDGSRAELGSSLNQYRGMRLLRRR